jgi:branched-chain amino acid transport system permease protein
VLWLQALIYGILLGGLYACMAIGFSVIWGVMNIINLAHGSMIVAGAYITYFLWHDFGIDPFLTIPVSGAALFVAGFLLQTFLLNRVVQASVFMTLILTFGLEMIFTNTQIALFTADIRSVRPSYAGDGFDLGSINVPYTRIAVFVVAVLLTLALSVFMNRSRTGNAIKATSFDIDAAQLVGMNTGRVYAITFGIGAMMAGIAGSLVAVIFTFSPGTSVSFTTKAFVVVILGGLGSIPGAIVGGVILGVAENFTSVAWDPGYIQVVSFGLLLVILVWRRKGIFGKRFYAEI